MVPGSAPAAPTQTAPPSARAPVKPKVTLPPMGLQPIKIPPKLTGAQRVAAIAAAVKKSETSTPPPATVPPAQGEITMSNLAPTAAMRLTSAGPTDEVTPERMSGGVRFVVRMQFPTEAGKVHVLDCRVESTARIMWVWQNNEEQGHRVEIEDGHLLYAVRTPNTVTYFSVNRLYADRPDTAGWSWYGCELTRLE